jgi:hypothetical protein
MSLLDPDWEPEYGRWHGDWAILNLVYPTGGCGNVSREYADGRWRITAEAEAGPVLHGVRSFRRRELAARAERETVLELYRKMVEANPDCYAHLSGLNDEELYEWGWRHRTNLDGARAFRDTFLQYQKHAHQLAKTRSNA